MFDSYFFLSWPELSYGVLTLGIPYCAQARLTPKAQLI